MNGTIKVSTRQFRRKHGHEPRGRFLWTFRVGDKDFGDGRLRPCYFSGRGEYEEVLAGAITHAEANGVTEVSVSSVVYGQDEGQ